MTYELDKPEGGFRGMAKDQLGAKFQVLFQKHSKTRILQRKDHKNSIHPNQRILPSIWFTEKKLSYFKKI